MNLPQLRSDLMILWLVATTALCVGLLVNQFRDTPLSLVYKDKAERLQDSVQRIATQQQAAAAPVSHLPEKLSLEEFSAYSQEKRGMILDARPEIFHRLGHVPGALSLPRDDFEAGYAALKGKLESDRSQMIVIYCSSTSCEDSGLVKKSLASLGYTNLALFEGGWSEWTNAKKPEETAQ
jgi:3-mercaptopyruvate sulfurtransferase SseA